MRAFHVVNAFHVDLDTSLLVIDHSSTISVIDILHLYSEIEMTISRVIYHNPTSRFLYACS